MKVRLKFIIVGIATLLCFGGLGLLFMHLSSKRDLLPFIVGRYNMIYQVGFGVLVGVIFGWLAWKMISMPYLFSLKKFYSGLFNNISANDHMLFIFLSLCAGIGEELFFRGWLQSQIGIWPCAVLFVAIHGYLNPMNMKLTIYGLFMIPFIAILGYMTEAVEIASSAMAHAAFDYLLIKNLTKFNSEIKNDV